MTVTHAPHSPVAGEVDIANGVPLERARVLRLCTRLTGDREAAEDLTQETFVEAWRHAHKLHDPDGRDAWLAAIAHNVYRRWARRRSRELARVATPDPRDGPRVEESLPDGIDLEIELERDELAHLLDQALALLPPDTREALVRRFVDGTPHAEIAARLGVSEDAVSMRLSRGKLALRRALATAELREAAVAYGLCAPDGERWDETRLWCLICGRHRLRGRFTAATFTLRCPACSLPDLPYARAGPAEMGATVGQLKSYRPAYTRLMAWVGAYVVPALPTRAVLCTACGHPAPIRLGPHGPVPYYVGYPYPACGHVGGTSLNGLVLTEPEGVRFWRAHPRLRKLPEREVEARGRPAIVTTFESVTGPARIDLVSARDTYETLAVHATGLPPAGA